MKKVFKGWVDADCTEQDWRIWFYQVEFPEIYESKKQALDDAWVVEAKRVTITVEVEE